MLLCFKKYNERTAKLAEQYQNGYLTFAEYTNRLDEALQTLRIENAKEVKAINVANERHFEGL